MLAAIRPRGKDRVWALPKGHIDEGESAAETALREVHEETGVEGRVVEKLGDIRYVVHGQLGRAKGRADLQGRELLPPRPVAGGSARSTSRCGSRSPRRAGCPLDEAPRLLSYDGEREMAAKALERLRG